MHKKMYLDNLPRRGKTNQIDWSKYVGITVNFIYDNYSGDIHINNVDTKTRKLEIIYNGKHQIVSFKTLQNSAMELSRRSEQDFGVYLHRSAIGRCAQGILKQYKGFTFEYVNEV